MKTSSFALTVLAAAVPAFATVDYIGSGSGSSESYAVPEQGQECNVEALTQAGYNVVEACCEGDDKDLCPEYKQCRIANVVENNDIQCLCVTEPEVGDKCDADLLFPKTTECDADCEECRVSKVDGEGLDSSVECGCVEVGEKTCDYYAYDNCDYCRDEEPKPYGNPTEGFEVSVCGDATYKIKTDDVTKICSGDGEAPEGDLCPKKGDLASEHCRAEVWSFVFGPEGECEAPEDAQCMKLKTTGAWGCVFPTNANEKRGCLSENVCTEAYEKVDGTDMCQSTETGYPIQVDTESPDYINTTIYSEPSATLVFKTDGDSAATMTNVLSLVVGIFATSLAIFASL